jgi:hypothetical protein
VRAVGWGNDGSRQPTFFAALLPYHLGAKNCLASRVSGRSVSAFLANSTTLS